MSEHAAESDVGMDFDCRRDLVLRGRTDRDLAFASERVFGTVHPDFRYWPARFPSASKGGRSESGEKVTRHISQSTYIAIVVTIEAILFALGIYLRIVGH